MKKTMLAMTLGLMSLGAVGAVQAQDTNGAGGFVGAEVGSAHWHADGQGTNRFAYGVNGGYRWALDERQSLGAELGAVDFGTLRGHNAIGSTSLDARGYTLGANYRYTVNDDYYLQGRAGYMRWDARASASTLGGRVHDNTDGNGWYAGAAIGHDFTPQFSMNVGYTFHRANNDGDHANLGVAAVGAEYRF